MKSSDCLRWYAERALSDRFAILVGRAIGYLTLVVVPDGADRAQLTNDEACLSICLAAAIAESEGD